MCSYSSVVPKDPWIRAGLHPDDSTVLQEWLSVNIFDSMYGQDDVIVHRRRTIVEMAVAEEIV